MSENYTQIVKDFPPLILYKNDLMKLLSICKEEFQIESNSCKMVIVIRQEDGYDKIKNSFNDLYKEISMHDKLKALFIQIASFPHKNLNVQPEKILEIDINYNSKYCVKLSLTSENDKWVKAVCNDIEKIINSCTHFKNQITKIPLTIVNFLLWLGIVALTFIISDSVLKLIIYKEQFPISKTLLLSLNYILLCIILVPLPRSNTKMQV